MTAWTLAAIVAPSILLAILVVWGRPLREENRLFLPREPEGRVVPGWRPRTRVRPGRGPMDRRDL